MTSIGKTWLVLNQASGSYDEEREALLLEGLERAGRKPDRIVDCSSDHLPDAATLDNAGVGFLVVHGGDGTLNSAIGRLDGWAGTVLALPGGTANLLCKMLYGEAEIDAILDALAAEQLSPTRRPCVKGKGWLALAEVLAGPGANWADVREEMREGNIVKVVAGALDAASASTVGPMVALETPELGRPEGYAGIRIVPEAAGMMIDGYGANEVGDYLKQAVAILGRDFRAGPHDEFGLHSRAILRMTEEAPIPLMVDGERHDGHAREECVLAELAVDLLCMAHA